MSSRLGRIFDAFGEVKSVAEEEGGLLEEIVDRICEALTECDGAALRRARSGMCESRTASFVEQCRSGSFNKWLRANDQALSKLNTLFREAASERNLPDAILLDGLKSVVIALVHLKKFGWKCSQGSLERMLARTADALESIKERMTPAETCVVNEIERLSTTRGVKI